MQGGLRGATEGNTDIHEIGIAVVKVSYIQKR
jgi:hypothetical protein